MYSFLCHSHSSTSTYHYAASKFHIMQIQYEKLYKSCKFSSQAVSLRSVDFRVWHVRQHVRKIQDFLSFSFIVKYTYSCSPGERFLSPHMKLSSDTSPTVLSQSTAREKISSLTGICEQSVGVEWRQTWTVFLLWNDLQHLDLITCITSREKIAFEPERVQDEYYGLKTT
jgi:hypothetical protein